MLEWLKAQEQQLVKQFTEAQDNTKKIEGAHAAILQVIQKLEEELKNEDSKSESEEIGAAEA